MTDPNVSEFRDPRRTERLLRRFTSKARAASRFIAQRGILKPTVWSLVRVQVIGEHHARDLPPQVIVVANHASHLDAPLIIGALPRRSARYLAAGAAADYFFDVWWRRGLTSLFFNAFPVDRTGVNPRGVTARALLERNVPLLIFPEGTRSPDGRIRSFKPGAARLALAAGAVCLPVALVGTDIAHPRGSNWPKRGRLPVTVVFGAPLAPRAGESANDFAARLRSTIAGMQATHTGQVHRNDTEHGAIA
ncbi:lysophospholipid acyltransferase family protein [Agromyces seonyuensis]|uniref:1-acyl-sn-glycerol-3-phosphate acyltransferase n=1 Tax=Agromyces seonyuensis TaxID=2662446 RepID=A0A6I4P188_9MICO|nr:lysophospholipid acyltransferase family protein [Agromyces seonyuensis]MWB98495.1 1-acyl-sn-glycerol-3-phosphate acyltransferase [Agromyces seonyuensis]